VKLYSRGQLVGVILICGAIFGLLAVGMGLVRLPNTGERPSDTTETALTDGDPLLLEAQTKPSIDQLKISTADLLPYSEGERENISVYDSLNEAVVNITTETVALNWFLEPVPQDGGSGSGSIIDARGYVLTNNHVISNAIKVYINLADGSQFDGTVVGIDPENDLAVLKFSPPAGLELKIVPYGDSGNVRVGQKVMAIGNPFGFERTLSVGIISGIGRPIKINNRNIIKDMIQTDASINPGNSGGPLLDAHGKMIGITTMIYSPSGGSVGIGLAIPVNTAKRVVAELIEYGKVRRGWVDATLVQLFPALVTYAKLSVDKGLLVSRTKKGGLSEKAGLKQGSEAARYGSSVIYLGGDILTSVDGQKIDTLADYYSALEDNKPGDKVAVEIIRADKPLTLTITLTDRDINE
jgi:S1-C subfamily serine protease